MITQRVTGKAELLALLARLIHAEVPLEAEISQGEFFTTNPDGSPRGKRNSTLTAEIRYRGGARDSGTPQASEAQR